LSGKKILVTRTVQQAGKLSEALKALGAVPVEVPLLEIQPPPSFEPLDGALKKLSGFHLLILTSANTVSAVIARCKLLDVAFGDEEQLKVAAVGGATAEAARRAGFRVTIVPDNYNSEGLVAALGDLVAGKRVLLARAVVARDVIPDELRKAGANLTVVDAYQTGLPSGAREQLEEAMRVGVDAATFTSSSSVRNLAEVAREAGVGFPLAGVAGFSIGPVTSATMREFGWAPAGEAGMSDLPGLVEAVRQGVGSREQGIGSRRTKASTNAR